MNSCPKPLPHLPQLTCHCINNKKTWVCGCTFQYFDTTLFCLRGSMVAPLLQGSGLDTGINQSGLQPRVPFLDSPGHHVLCPWARPFPLKLPLSSQLYVKWVLAILMLGVTLQWTTCNIPFRGEQKCYYM